MSQNVREGRGGVFACLFIGEKQKERGGGRETHTHTHTHTHPHTHTQSETCGETCQLSRFRPENPDIGCRLNYCRRETPDITISSPSITMTTQNLQNLTLFNFLAKHLTG